MTNALSNETPLMPLDTLYLLALLDLKTERLLAEVEPLIEAIANVEAQIASAEDMRYD
jgi:hypothetical protein